MKNQELEVKFYVIDLPAIRNMAKEINAVLAQERTFESNLRFDTPDGTLTRNFQVLRLRQDTAARLTFKGPAGSLGGARLRPEIEFVVGDFETARVFLEALGYQVKMTYEKYRTVYDLEGVHITLDELPYGNFVELEGPDPESIHHVNEQLHLDWDAQIILSYTALFERLRDERNYPFQDLTFENFKEIDITPDILHVTPADR